MPVSVHPLFQSLGITIPIIQAPMAGVDTPELAIAVSEAGGLGSLACAMLSPDQIRAAWEQIRAKTAVPINLNFFCHQQEPDSAARQEQWKQKLAPYYRELGLDIENIPPSVSRAPFDENFCAVVEEIQPQVVSFHFGLPPSHLLARVKNTGAIIMSSATTLDEAIWLEQNGCDVIIAQGTEAGGHRGMFLNDDINDQPSTADLLTAIVAKVKVPVIAAGGIADAEGAKKALSMGAIAVQLGTAYLFCPEAKVSPLYRAALEADQATTLTNIFSGRPARGIVNRFIGEMGGMSADAPEFPHASRLVAPLRQASEKAGRLDFMQMWAGTNRIPHTLKAKEFTEQFYARLSSLD